MLAYSRMGRTSVVYARPRCLRVRSITSYAADAECPCCVVYQL